MSHEIRHRIVRDATAEEKQRHGAARQQVHDELSNLRQWARQSAAQHQERVVVGTVFSADETAIVAAIDQYAAAHDFANRGEVVREALSRLLEIPIAR